MSPEERKKHDKREKKVVAFLTQSTEEINQAFSIIDGKPIINDRPKLILVFTALDIFYTYWQEYLSKKVSQKIGFPSWIDSFCFVKENKVYQSNPCLKKITSQQLYELRNSMVHFYGLRRKTDNVNLMVISDLKDQEYIDELTQEFDNKTKGVNVILQPKLLRDLIWEGGILMMGKMIDNLRSSPNKHIEGIKNIHTEVIERGAARIEFE
ncbi:hypothetical protein IPN35_00065 [Candidatus Peregrinibacteria bacterium]|nr:MAG: hypothetical protein IPN35_00065 [Candidatus Peregrinibacteria bacterium]